MILSAENLSKSYRDGELIVRAANNISFEVKRKTKLALLGRSGSGKSTLMHLLAGMDRPTSGTVRLDSIDYSKLSRNEIADLRLRRIGMVYQSFQLLPGRTSFENIELPLILAGISPRIRRDQVSSALRDVRMEHRARHKPTQLSGGEQQRVAIARAIVHQPMILFADEPTGNLDVENSQIVIDLLKTINSRKEMTMVMITHDEDLAHQFADRIIRMESGAVISDSSRTECRSL